MGKQEYFDELNKDQQLRAEVLEINSSKIERVVNLIKDRDKMKYPDADESENVVDVECISLPVLAAIQDAFFEGMYREYQRQTKL